MQEAETKQYWFEPVQDRSFFVGSTKTPSPRFYRPPLEALERIANVFLPLPPNGSIQVLLMSAFSGTLNSRHGCPLSAFFFFFPKNQLDNTFFCFLCVG